MKRLNNKGFTLIELLAVIVILAVVLVVTIPSVLNSMKNARQGAYDESIDIIEKYVNGEREKCIYNLEDIAEYNTEIFDEDCKLIGTREDDEEAAVNETSDVILNITGYDKEISLVTFTYNEESGKYEIARAPITDDSKFKGVEARNFKVQDIDTGDIDINPGGGGIVRPPVNPNKPVIS